MAVLMLAAEKHETTPFAPVSPRHAGNYLFLDH